VRNFSYVSHLIIMAKIVMRLEQHGSVRIVTLVLARARDTKTIGGILKEIFFSLHACRVVRQYYAVLVLSTVASELKRHVHQHA
jgi:hypothetical protein